MFVVRAQTGGWDADACQVGQSQRRYAFHFPNRPASRMNWITFIWSMTAGICLALGAVHFLIWTRQRGQWANLVFSVSAAAAAGYAVLDMIALRAQTPAEYGAWMRWMLSLGMLEGVLIAWLLNSI